MINNAEFAHPFKNKISKNACCPVMYKETNLYLYKMYKHPVKKQVKEVPVMLTAETLNMTPTKKIKQLLEFIHLLVKMQPLFTRLYSL